MFLGYLELSVSCDARFMGGYWIYGEERNFCPLEVKTEACTLRIPTTSVHFVFTILLASIESDLVFSSAFIQCFKLRSHMSEAILDNMLFLRIYFTKISVAFRAKQTYLTVCVAQVKLGSEANGALYHLDKHI
jgi:hypothetical protein